MHDWSIAERKLLRMPAMRPLVRRIGPCALTPLPRPPYEALVRAIAHQQVHGRAAEAMLNRLIALHPGEGFPPPGFVLDLPAEALRGCGFSGSKCAAIQDIAAKSVSGQVPPLDEALSLPDEALVERLLPLRGVGRWTVEMLLIFTLGRPDVWPVDDFGVREGWRRVTGAEAQLKPRELMELGAPFRPWRSVAAWYLWRAADEGKKVKPLAV